MNILELPEDCLSLILSLTSPRDVVRSSAVSKHFLSVSASDTVWDKFLPSECDDIISQSSSLISVLSKKDLFMHLCDFPVLLDNNTKSFGLDKRSGKICYMLGSRALSIVWGSSPEYWRWKSVPGSRFPECAVLIAVCWLEIKGRIQTTLLSQGTPYGVYFVFKINAGRYSGFGGTLVKGSVSRVSEDGLPILGDECTIEIKSFYLEGPRVDVESEEESPWGFPIAQVGESEVEDEEESLEELLVDQDEENKEDEDGCQYEESVELPVTREEESEEESFRELLVAHDEESEEEESFRELLVAHDESEEEELPDAQDMESEEESRGELLATQDGEVEEEFLGELPVARDDGWMEIELGQYQVGVYDGDERVVLEMSLKEVEKLYWKNGLIVNGIEIRPLP